MSAQVTACPATAAEHNCTGYSFLLGQQESRSRKLSTLKPTLKNKYQKIKSVYQNAI